MSEAGHNRNRASDSLVNVFDDTISRRKTVESVVTVDELSSMSMNNANEKIAVDETDVGFDNFDSKMTKEKYLESIFGPSRVLNEKKNWKQKIQYVCALY